MLPSISFLKIKVKHLRSTYRTKIHHFVKAASKAYQYFSSYRKFSYPKIYNVAFQVMVKAQCYQNQSNISL